MAEDGVAAVALKLPTFWTENPDVWFLQVEAQSGLRLLVDTGAQVSVLPATGQDRRNGQPGQPLIAANGTEIPTFGTRNVPLHFGSRHYTWRFTLANVSRAIIGGDFLRSNGLLVDIRGQRLIEFDMYASIPASRSSTMAPRLHYLAENHKPLTFAMARVSEPWSARQQRHLNAISEYTTDIQHIAGKDNAVADALSRTAINAINDGIYYQAMAADQAIDCATQAYRTAITNLRFEVVPFGGGKFTLLCDVSTGMPRPVVPTKWRRTVFDAVHKLSHPDISTKSCARALVATWVARFSVPLHISSDRGPPFISSLWSAIAELLGTKLHHTTSYHPQANGLVERFHRTMKAALKSRLSGPNWIDELPWVMLGIRTAPKEDLKTSSAELVYGAPLTVPGDFVPDSGDHAALPAHLRQLRDKVGSLAPIPTSQHGAYQSSVPANLAQAKYVFIRRDSHRHPLQKPYEGPFEVLEAGEKTFKVQLGNRSETISVDRLKPAHLDIDQPVRVAQPPTRGRPPATLQPDQQFPPPPQHQDPPGTLTTQQTRSGRQTRIPTRFL